MFKVIDGRKKERKSAEWYGEKYLQQVAKHLECYQETGDRCSFCGAVYCMIRQFNLMEHQDTHIAFQLSELLQEGIGEMTPTEFIRTFPPNKTYDGAKWGCIDYFSTMGKFKGLPMDKPMCKSVEEILDILMGYDNHHILEYSVKVMMLVSRLHKEQTGRDMLDDFVESMGKPPLRKYYLHTDDQGKQYMIDDEGNSHAVKKARPRYLRVVD